jgi:hypothetical protein
MSLTQGEGLYCLVGWQSNTPLPDASISDLLDRPSGICDGVNSHDHRPKQFHKTGRDVYHWPKELRVRPYPPCMPVIRVDRLSAFLRTIPMISYDLFLNIFLTGMFLYPLWRDDFTSLLLKNIATRTL